MNANIKAKETEVLMPVIDDGLEAIEITNTIGLVIGTWYYNPADVGIVDRYNAALPKLEVIFEPLQNASISATGEGTDEESWGIVNEAKARLFDALTDVFGDSFIDAFFKNTHPFTPVKGQFYVENVLEYARKVIELRMDVELNKVNSNVQKYTEAYAKKKKQHEKTLPKQKEAEDE